MQNPTQLAHRIEDQSKSFGYFYLTNANLTAMEQEAGTVHQWLHNHGYTDTATLMPDGPHGDLIELADDTKRTEVMATYHHLAHIRWICMVCQRTGNRHPGTDEGADQAGIEMLRHSLDHPHCHEDVWLEAVA